jgi:hypothetical protein
VADPNVHALAPDVTEWPGNADVDWDKLFDPDAYFALNYQHLHREDAEIISIVANHFAKYGPQRWRANAIDVGSGTNLYPALTMLPFAGRITLYERAYPNREWLTAQLEKPADSWLQFWKSISDGRPAYQNVDKPLAVLSGQAEVVRGNVLALPPERYDMGTMFFVAESITTRADEFRRATRRFVGSLTSKAPFAAAFMRDSSGYVVAGKSFPACSITEKDVERCLAPVAYIEDIQVVDSSDLREGYCGMIVATGRKR